MRRGRRTSTIQIHLSSLDILYCERMRRRTSTTHYFRKINRAASWNSQKPMTQRAHAIRPVLEPLVSLADFDSSPACSCIAEQARRGKFILIKNPFSAAMLKTRGVPRSLLLQVSWWPRIYALINRSPEISENRHAEYGDLSKWRILRSW